MPNRLQANLNWLALNCDSPRTSLWPWVVVTPLNTSPSSLRGVAANDEVLSQNLSLCAPQARIQLPGAHYVLEGRRFALPVDLDASISRASITQGQSAFCNRGCRARS